MKDSTEIVVILDRSGSMQGLKPEIIGQFNKFLQEQKAHPSPATYTLVQFDDEYELVHSGLPLQSAPDLTDGTYSPRGMTALFDAICKTIDNVGNRLLLTPEADRPNKVLFVIITDGQENHSAEFRNLEVVKEKIEHQRTKYNWEFIFLAQGLDAYNQVLQFNLPATNYYHYDASPIGIRHASTALSASTTAYRSGEDVNLQGGNAGENSLV